MKKLYDKYLQSGIDFCNLQSVRRLMLLIQKRFQPDCRLQTADCSRPLQSGIPHNKSMGYGDFQIAHSLPHTFGMGWCTNPLARFVPTLFHLFFVAGEEV